MGDVVNLNQKRKARVKAAVEKTAANTRVKHGTPKSLRKLTDSERNKANRNIDDKRLDD